jgi:hypothetical protein
MDNKLLILDLCWEKIIFGLFVVFFVFAMHVSV